MDHSLSEAHPNLDQGHHHTEAAPALATDNALHTDASPSTTLPETPLAPPIESIHEPTAHTSQDADDSVSLLSEPPPHHLDHVEHSPEKAKVEETLLDQRISQSDHDDDDLILGESEPAGLDHDDDPVVSSVAVAPKGSAPTSPASSMAPSDAKTDLSKGIRSKPTNGPTGAKPASSTASAVGGAVKKVASGAIGGVKRVLDGKTACKHCSEQPETPSIKRTLLPPPFVLARGRDPCYSDTFISR